MACRRDESALFFTGDENLVELAGVVEYRYDRDALAELLFGVADVENTVSRAAEGVFREVTGRTALEAILVSGRSQFEESLGRGAARAIRGLRRAACWSTGCAWSMPIRPAKSCRPTATFPRPYPTRNEASIRPVPTPPSGTGRRSPTPRPSAMPPRPRPHRLVSRVTGEKDGVSRQGVVTRGSSVAYRISPLVGHAGADPAGADPKLILDRKAAGRRHVWLADPAQLGPVLGRALPRYAPSLAPGSPTIELRFIAPGDLFARLIRHAAPGGDSRNEVTP